MEKSKLELYLLELCNSIVTNKPDNIEKEIIKTCKSLYKIYLAEEPVEKPIHIYFWPIIYTTCCGYISNQLLFEYIQKHLKNLTIRKDNQKDTNLYLILQAWVNVLYDEKLTDFEVNDNFGLLIHKLAKKQLFDSLHCISRIADDKFILKTLLQLVALKICKSIR